MSKETIRQTIDQIKTTDSMKAVKVAIDMNELQDITIQKLIDLIGTMDKNMKLLAVKVLELDKKVEGLEAYANREI